MFTRQPFKFRQIYPRFDWWISGNAIYTNNIYYIDNIKLFVTSNIMIQNLKIVYMTRFFKTNFCFEVHLSFVRIELLIYLIFSNFYTATSTSKCYCGDLCCSVKIFSQYFLKCDLNMFMLNCVEKF